jgi:hypothetical protein
MFTREISLKIGLLRQLIQTLPLFPRCTVQRDEMGIIMVVIMLMLVVMMMIMGMMIWMGMVRFV